jgi:hypothetical protein
MSTFKTFIRNLNRLGIPLPMVRDPATSVGSVSLTLVFLSSILVVIEIIGEVFNLSTHPVNSSTALEFFFASSALYFGRKWTSRKRKKSLPEKTDGSE